MLSWPNCCSVVKNLLVFCGSVVVHEGLQSRVRLRLQLAGHEADLVHLEHGLEQILTAVLHHAFELGVAWVVVETVVVQVRLVYLHRGPLVAHHELLESQETDVPTITFLVSHELGDRGWMRKHGADLELPDAAINLAKAKEWPPVFQMLGFVCRQWVLSNVGNHVLIIV